MTRIDFFNEGGRITGFRCQGHSGYAEAGADVVCAAITALTRMAECTIRDVCGVNAKTRVDEDAASLSLLLPAKSEEEETVQAVLSGFMLTLSALRDEYPDYLEVMEVQQNA